MSSQPNAPKTHQTTADGASSSRHGAPPRATAAGSAPARAPRASAPARATSKKAFADSSPEPNAANEDVATGKCSGPCSDHDARAPAYTDSWKDAQDVRIDEHDASQSDGNAPSSGAIITPTA
jgi:hypothetical protein